MCFKNTGYKILTDSWYQHKYSSKEEERKYIIETAATITVQDTCSRDYETSQYSPPDNFLQENESVIPETLCIFTETLILNKKHGDLDKWKKCIIVAHTLINAMHPSRKVELATFLYKFSS